MVGRFHLLGAGAGRGWARPILRGWGWSWTFFPSPGRGFLPGAGLEAGALSPKPRLGRSSRGQAEAALFPHRLRARAEAKCSVRTPTLEWAVVLWPKLGSLCPPPPCGPTFSPLPKGHLRVPGPARPQPLASSLGAASPVSPVFPVAPCPSAAVPPASVSWDLLPAQRSSWSHSQAAQKTVWRGSCTKVETQPNVPFLRSVPLSREAVPPLPSHIPGLANPESEQ